VSQGVLAVVELLVKAQACDYMIVANAISCLNHVMEGLQVRAAAGRGSPFTCLQTSP
jgi:hypothetical protein